MKNYFVYITRRCNLECAYCYQRDKKKEDISCETLEKVLDYVLKDNDPNKRVNLFGGEPTLRWDLVRYTVRKLTPSVKINITTNGTLLDEEKLEFLRAHDVGIALSVDGPPGITRKTRPGSERICIDDFARYYPHAQIIMTLNPSIIADAYRSTLWFIEKGFRNIAHNIATEKPWPPEAERVHDEQFSLLADWYIRGGFRDASFLFIGYAMKAVRQANLPDSQRHICGANPGLIAFDTNGDIYPCQDMVSCDTEGKYKLGNIETGYTPAQSQPLTRMKFPDREGKCRTCWFHNQCVGGCGPKNIVACGDRYGVTEYGCRMMATQVREGLRALLNTGQLDLKTVHRKDKGPKHGGK